MTSRAPFQVPDLPRDRPTVPEVLPLVRALYRRSATGCCFHVVLDDGNYDCVPWCVANLAEHGCREGAHTECHELAKLLPLMSKTQLRKLARNAYTVGFAGFVTFGVQR